MNETIYLFFKSYVIGFVMNNKMNEGNLSKRIDQCCNGLVNNRGIEGLLIAIVNEGKISGKK